MNTVISKMKIEPLFDRVLLRVIEDAPVSKGGLAIPERAQDRPVRGTVVAVGPGKVEFGRFVETVLKVGDTVLFGKFTGAEIVVDDEKLMVMGESEVIARLRDEAVR